MLITMESVGAGWYGVTGPVAIGIQVGVGRGGWGKGGGEEEMEGEHG